MGWNRKAIISIPHAEIKWQIGAETAAAVSNLRKRMLKRKTGKSHLF